MRWLVIAIFACVAFAFVALGTFLPIRRDAAIEYVFVWSGERMLAMAIVLVVAVLTTAYLLVRRLALQLGPERLEDARTGVWLAPLAGIGALALGILPAVPGVGEKAAPIAYFFYDLRWWWVLLLGGWTLVRADRLLGGVTVSRARSISQWSPAGRLLLLDAVVLLSVVTWAVATSPRIRFGAGPFGDEPKYLRFCEAWYQGKGCDVSDNLPFVEARLDGNAAVGRNVSLLGAAIADDARAMVEDVRQFAADPSGFRWNRVSGGHDGFVTGKRGGLYQLHQPGLSLLLFPGYFIDRHLLARAASYYGEFPGDLPLTTSTVLALFGLCAVALFRLLRNAMQSEWLAAVLATFAMATFPASAFAFQIYPEIPALLVIVLLVNHVCFWPRPERLASGLWAGLAAGSLAWLHPRFLAVAGVLALAEMLRSRGAARGAFASAFVFVLMTVGAYTYHITGSWMLNALYVSSDTHQIVPSAIVDNLISYAIHGTLGLVPHALWLAAVIPGLVVMARRQPVHGALVLLVGLALAVPAAGHALNPAGGTPGRFVLAVVPLMIWPAAVLIRVLWPSSRVIRAVAVASVVLSLDAALAYNWSHEKQHGAMVDQAMSGWKPNLAFPEIREYFSDPDARGLPVAAALMALGVLSAVAGARVKLAPVAARRARSPVWSAAASVVVMVGVMTMATAALGQWTRTDYTISDEAARARAEAAMAALDRCRVCFSSTRTQVDARWLAGDSR